MKTDIIDQMYYLLKQAQNVKTDMLNTAIVSTLFKRLEQEVSIKSTDHMSSDFSTSLGPDQIVQPKIGDLTNVDNFISWLGLQQITYKGQPIVLIGNSSNNQTKQETTPIKTWETNDQKPVKTWGASVKIDNVKTAQQVVLPPGQENKYKQYQGIYWVNPEALKAFINDLQKSAAKSKNNLFEHLVGGRGGLLEQINSLSNQLGVKVENKINQLKQENNKNVEIDNTELDIDETTIVDKIPNPIILNNPRMQGTVPLSLANLKTQATFADWITRGKISFKNSAEEKQANLVEIKQEYCFVLTYLLARSKMYNTTGSKAYQYYTKLSENLINAYGCSSEVKTDKNINNEDSQNKFVSWQQGQPLTAQMQQKLAPIITRFPLLQDRIDFNLINSWVASYQQIISTIPGARVESAAIKEVADVCQSMFSHYEITQQPLTQSAVDIYRSLRMRYISKNANDPRAAQTATSVPFYYVNSLARMLTSLESILLSFKSYFYDSLPNDWKLLLDRQIDDSGSSLSAINRRQVAQWISLMPAARQEVERAI